ncbi:MAG: slipin family protein, partial [Chloroflexota bacterium]|jgi:regulator of protease activity HflC (stomatin/prohibitin superfamily)
MQRAMAKQAEAEREKRAKIIHAQGEFDASARLADAAEMLNRTPTALQLRYMQTLTEIATEKNSTIVFPLPIDLLKGILDFGKLNGHAEKVVSASPRQATPPEEE